jgi:hypothetical protein
MSVILAVICSLIEKELIDLNMINLFISTDSEGNMGFLHVIYSSLNVNHFWNHVKINVLII